VPRPATGETPIRHVRIAAKLWDQIVQIAEAEGRSASSIVVEALARWLVWHKRKVRRDG